MGETLVAEREITLPPDYHTALHLEHYTEPEDKTISGGSILLLRQASPPPPVDSWEFPRWCKRLFQYSAELYYYNALGYSQKMDVSARLIIKNS